MTDNVRAVFEEVKDGSGWSRRQFSLAAVAAAAGAAVGSARGQESGQPIAGYIVVDATSKKVLLAGNAARRRPVASLTKIATASVVLDWVDATGADLGQSASIPPAAAPLQPNPFGFQAGDALSLRNALCCAMMGSDNIAAETLAWHVGADLMRRTGRGVDPRGAFVWQMNALAGKLGMEKTKFLNPHGLDSAGPVPLSTAADMARVTLYALKKPAFAFYTSQRQRRISFQRAGSSQTFLLKNTNEVLGRNGIDGVKTGMTSRAGQCLILSAARKPVVVKIAEENHEVFPRRLVVVLLGAQDRFGQGLALLDQGWARYESWAASGRPVNDPAELLDPPAR